ncbi:MAG: cell division protein FtsX [Acidobacteriota bacterium]
MRVSRLLRHLLEDGLWGLWRSRGLSLAAALVIGLTFSIVALELMAAENLSRGVIMWGRAGVVRVFLKEGSKAGDAAILAARIRPWQGVLSVQMLDPVELRQRFSRWYPEMGDLADLFPESPFPAEVEVTLADDLDAAGRQAVVARLEGQAEVDTVLADDPVGDHLKSVAAQVRRVGQLCGLFFALVAALVVAGVIRLSLVSQQDEMAVMQVVGAPRLLLMGPWVLQGLFLGAAGGLVALALAGAVHLLAIRLEAAGAVAAFLAQRSLEAGPAALLVGLAGLAGGLGAMWAVGKGGSRT